jgi:hypothetical protein
LTSTVSVARGYRRGPQPDVAVGGAGLRPPYANFADLPCSLDVSQTSTGLPATAFTHVIHQGGSTFIQYWLYYPDSNTTWAGSDKAFKYSPPGVRLISRLVTGKWRYPGFHNDDWERN